MSKSITLNMQITTGDPRPIFKQIVDEIRIQIARGELPVGAKLPSVRGLALQLMVNANTVAKAYNELNNQGLVESRQGLGLFIAPQRQRLSDAEQQQKLQQALATFVNEVAYLDYSKQEVVAAVSDALHRLETAATSNGE
ncbi:GntR family transcriptional regulator [Planctobacterium marinum]|uniref:GntR family transcriptional regulator n=1 Tax=Planctobacterium marinum TaxID=1631968 RepID=A0AA48HEE9_9ALTE|nr:GntR family transcriptional regulator [Planctobacterium marinum]